MTTYEVLSLLFLAVLFWSHCLPILIGITSENNNKPTLYLAVQAGLKT